MSKGSQKFVSRLLLESLIVCLLLNAVQLYLFFWSQGHSAQIFTDQDEPYYLQLALDRGRQFFGERPIMEETIFSQLSYNMADTVVGVLAVSAKLDAARLGLLLDLFCAPLTYIAAAVFFSTLSRSLNAPRVAALLAVFFPHLLSLLPSQEIASFGPLLWKVSGAASSLMVLRAIATQLSIPLFFVVSAFLSKTLQSKDPQPKQYLLAGFWGGLLLYVYFFAWSAFGLLYVTWSMFLILRDPSRLRAIFYGVLLISFGYIASSLPGLIQQFVSGNSEHLRLTAEMRKWVSLSPGDLTLLVISIAALYKLTFLDPYKLTLFGACCLACIVPYLLQPLIGIALTPYHYALLFMNPVLVGCGALVLAECRSLSSEVKRIASIIVVAAATIPVLIQGTQTIYIAKRSTDIEELVLTLRRQLQVDETFAMVPFLRPYEDDFGSLVPTLILPSAVQALTERRYWEPIHEAKDGVVFGERVFLLGALFSGAYSPIATCKGSPPQLPGDISDGIVTFFNTLSYESCQRVKRRLENHERWCELFQKDLPNYLVWESPGFASRPPFLEIPIWTNSNNRFQLFRISPSQILSHFCASA